MDIDTGNQEQPQPPKRSRKSAPKSRSGCITCKARHVRCDELRPFCKRCAKAGRRCEGYSQEAIDSQDDANTITSSSAVALTSRVSGLYLGNSSKYSTQEMKHLLPAGHPSGMPVLINSSSRQELHSLEYFYTRTAAAMSGYYDTNLYSRLLLQAGQCEPAIRHGMMAVGAMHEHFEFSVVPALESRSESLSCANKPAFALQQYNKAIGAISKQLSSGAGSTHSILMCCLLFVCLECLRGDASSAATHLKSGSMIIANMARQKRRSASLGPSSTSTDSMSPKSIDNKFIDDNLAPIFERFSTHVLGASGTTASEITELVNPNIYHEHPDDISFKSLEEARQSIMNIGSLVARFARSVAPTKFGEPITDHQVRVVAGLQRKMQLWEQSLAALLAKQAQTPTPRRAVILQIQHICFKVATIGILAREQSVNDYVTRDFENGIDLAERLLDNQFPAEDDERELTSFSFEEGVGPALFLFATRCRIPDLRRKSIATMWKHPRRQGIWNIVLLAKVSERVIELEENFVPPPTATTTATAGQERDRDEEQLHQQQEVTTSSELSNSLATSAEPLLDEGVDPSSMDLPLTPESIENNWHGETIAPLSVDLEPCMTLPLPAMDPQHEFGIDALPQPPPPQQQSLTLLPVEAARIHHVDIKESTDGTPHQHAVTFFRKPHGLDEAWDIWTELIFI